MEAGSISVQWVLIVKVEITQNQRFDHVVLKEVLEFTQKEANCGLVSFLMMEGDRSQPVSLLMKH